MIFHIDDVILYKSRFEMCRPLISKDVLNYNDFCIQIFFAVIWSSLRFIFIYFSCLLFFPSSNRKFSYRIIQLINVAKGKMDKTLIFSASIIRKVKMALYMKKKLLAFPSNVELKNLECCRHFVLTILHVRKMTLC